MAQKKLRDVLEPAADEADCLRWRAAVPLATNPFLMLEVGQFALVGAAVVLLTLCLGVRVTEGVLTPENASMALRISVTVFLALIAGFALISLVFFGNRYFAVFQAEPSGIYHEGSRGENGRTGPFLRMRAMPVVGSVKAARTRGRELPWEKADRFHDISSMRVIILKRGFWHMLRLYTPDDATHELVVRYLTQRFPHGCVRKRQEKKDPRSCQTKNPA